VISTATKEREVARTSLFTGMFVFTGSLRIKTSPNKSIIVIKASGTIYRPRPKDQFNGDTTKNPKTFP